MLDGIYSITFRGAADWGMGLLLLRNGTVVGADVGGVQYDGAYFEGPSSVDIDIVLTVPPGVQLAQGTPARATRYSFPIKSKLSTSALDGKQPATLDTPYGPVSVIFHRLRALDD